jgi:hypothetical protein
MTRGKTAGNPAPAGRTMDPGLRDLLELEVETAPEHRWEGRLSGEQGAARTHSVFVTARIAIRPAMLAGEGTAPEFPRSRAPGVFSLTGSASSAAVRFSLWFADAEIGRTPFDFDGTLDADERNMRGAWSFDCFYPDACGCGGGGGTFHLWRVD